MRGVYPPQCRDTVDYTPSVVCPPGVATQEGVYPPCEGYTPSCVATQKIIVYPLLCRDTGEVYPSHGGYTPSCVATPKIIVYPLLCRDTQGGIPLMRGVYPLLCRDTEDDRIPPAVSRHTGGIIPLAWGVYPLLCRR